MSKHLSKIFLLFNCLFLSACTFNKMFLAPEPIPTTARKFRLTAGNDTVLVRIDSATFQPTFFNTDNTPVHQNFTIESDVFESTSGNRLNGWWMRSDTVPVTATLLHFHGNAANLFGQYQALLPLVEHGFQIYIFDYSGFGFSTGKASRKNVLKDGFSGLAHARKHPYSQGMPFVLYGQSLGGHLSAVVAKEQQAVLDALVIEGAFSSHKDIAAYFVKRAIGTGFMGRWFVREMYSGKDALKDYKKPLLVIHSTEDEVIPLFMGQRLFEAGNEPKSFFEIRFPHICGPTYYPKEIAEKIRAMIEF